MALATEGFAIADGSVINDPRSPFNGFATPNLVDRFVLGVGSADDVGVTGGNDSLNLSHQHDMWHYHTGKTGNNSHKFAVVKYPPQPYEWCAWDSHTHNFTTDGPNTGVTGSELGMVSIMPPYVGLLKIIRIK